MPGMKGTMKEYKDKTLHSGSKSGPIVKSRAQAIAIGMSEERKEHKKNNSNRHAHLGENGSVKVSHSMVNGCSGKM
jgi:hypothetical protein